MTHVHPIDSFATEVLGPIEPISDVSNARGGVRVVRDRDGTKWVLKTTPREAGFRNERRAYTSWVPSFADQAPRLLAAAPRLRTLILDHVHGRPGRPFRAADQRAAGRLLRRVHESSPPPTHVDPLARMAPQLRRALDLRPARELIGAAEREFVWGELGAVRREFGALPAVACHGDFGAHNWLRVRRTLRVIDFAESRWDVPAADFARLHLGSWWERPDLSDAFYAGYGRTPTAEDLAAFRVQLPLLAIGLINHGVRHGNTALTDRARARLHRLMEGYDVTGRCA